MESWLSPIFPNIRFSLSVIGGARGRLALTATEAIALDTSRNLMAAKRGAAMFALVASSIRLIVYAPPLLKVMRGLSPMSAAFVVSLDRVGVRRR